jgi:uncharacterized protein DUF4384
MMILLAALSALSTSPSEVAEVAPRPEGERPPVHLWMNSDRRYREGDRVRLQVDADVDGFLLVLHFDPNGRLRILFPLDPRDDSRVQAGRRYEVRSESFDGAFRASGDGTGLIYTAVSEEPWRLDDIVLADRWDYTRLEIDSRVADPEPEITALVQRLAGPRGFDYDVMGYRVYGESSYTSYNTYVYPRGPTYVYDDYLYCNNWSWRYDGCRRWPYDGGWSFGLGFYNPYYYGYGYYPYRYRYGYGYSYPYYPYRPSYPSGRAPVLAGRPRSYTIVPRGSLGAGSRGSFGSGALGGAVTGPARGPSRVSVPEDGGRARGPGRPARTVDGRGPDNFSRGPEASSPPARRSRGSESYNAPPARGPDRSEPYRGNGRPERVDPSSREAPRARPEGRDAPRARSEPSREAPRERSQPARREPDRASAPPPQRDHGSRQAPPQASRGGNQGGGGGGGRSRRP